MRTRARLASLALVLASTTLWVTRTVDARQDPFLGRWSLTSTGEQPVYVGWLEVSREAGQLTARFSNRGGSPAPVASVQILNGELVFQPAAGRRGPSAEHRARVQGEKLMGSTTSGDRTIEFVGVRPPKWPAADASAPHKFAPPIELFDGKSMDAWDVQIKDRPIKWVVEDGAMTNTPPQANNLVSKQKFQDFKIHAEYKLDQRGVSRSGQPVKGNSGIYLRGRYELQVLDDFGDKPFERGHMSVYGWHTPTTNASKPAGEWQTMEATVVGNRVTVVLNGQKVQDNVTLEAITGGALDANESEPGPIVLQGDHEKVWYRKVTVTPITDPRK